jgi:hypothetical protein
MLFEVSHAASKGRVEFCDAADCEFRQHETDDPQENLKD